MFNQKQTNLYTFLTTNEDIARDLTDNEKISVAYHNIFDYPLSFAELIKWVGGSGLQPTEQLSVSGKNGFYTVEGREGLIYKKLLRKRISAKKLEIAKKASRILSFLPTIKMVAVTGSLAMENSTDESDIDLMIVTKKGTLWTSRLISLLLLPLVGMPIRRAGKQNEKDKLCLNMWFDESDLVWRDRNIYTAHEIAQVIPLVNKDKTYETFLFKNRWILDYWPNSVRITEVRENKTKKAESGTIEKIASKLQYLYMKSKVTRETVTPTRALFHPQDWGQVVLDRLKAYLVE